MLLFKTSNAVIEKEDYFFLISFGERALLNAVQQTGDIVGADFS